MLTVTLSLVRISWEGTQIQVQIQMQIPQIPGRGRKYRYKYKYKYKYHKYLGGDVEGDRPEVDHRDRVEAGQDEEEAGTNNSASLHSEPENATYCTSFQFSSSFTCRGGR